MSGRYAKFYNLTFLYKPKNININSGINYNNYANYTNKIMKHLSSSNGKYKDGDILFIGSYTNRQENGFVTVTQNGTNFKVGNLTMNTPGVYYRDAIKEINEFWTGFANNLYIEDNEWINHLKKFGHYNLNSNLNSKSKAATTIQTAFRKSRKPELTNEQFIRLWNKMKTGYYPTNQEVSKMNKYFYNDMFKVAANIRTKMVQNKKAAPAVTKIASVFRGYKTRNIDPRRQFLLSLSKDGRFDRDVEILARLEHKVSTVLGMVRQNANPHNAITNVIGVCHYKATPYKVVQDKKVNVRKNIKLLKKKTPREYLQKFRNQFSYVAKKYSKMDSNNKKKYRDRFYSELSGRPCLENLIDSLVKSLIKPEFVWLGKTRNYQNNPLVPPNNVRYLGFGPNLGLGRNNGLINTAIKTWQSTNNKPKNWENKNLNSRKQMFWSMIKNLPLSMIYNGTPVNGTPNLFNRGGIKFKKSIIANTLEWT